MSYPGQNEDESGFSFFPSPRARLRKDLGSGQRARPVSALWGIPALIAGIHTARVLGVVHALEPLDVSLAQVQVFRRLTHGDSARHGVLDHLDPLQLFLAHRHPLPSSGGDKVAEQLGGDGIAEQRQDDRGVLEPDSIVRYPFGRDFVSNSRS